MDRRYLALAALLAAGCSAGPTPLEFGVAASEIPAAVRQRAVASRGAIGYQAAFLGSRVLVSVELGVRFELVARRIDRARSAPVEIARVDLGPPDWDISAIEASPGPLVWVGSLDGSVRGIDLERARVVHHWRAGHAVTAIATAQSGRYLAYGTAEGVVCLRRVRDGALLQCLRAHGGRVSTISGVRDLLITGSWDGAIKGFAIPTLALRFAIELGGSINDLAARGSSLAAAASSAPPTGDRRRRDLEGRLAIVDFGPETSSAIVRSECIGHRGPVTAVRWTSDGALVSGGWDRALRQWETSGAACRQRWHHQLDGHHITSLALQGRGRYLAASLWVTALDQPGVVLLDFLYPPRR